MLNILDIISKQLFLVSNSDSSVTDRVLIFLIICFIQDSVVVSLPNNHYPQFVSSQYNAVVNENATIGSTVLTISASDNDTGAAGVVHYEGLQGTGSDYFALNSDTGEITSVKAFNTSSTPKVFFLTVTVRDRGSPVKYSQSKANITIGVQSPSYSNNQITSVSSTSMSIVLTKEPFDDSKILRYDIVAQQYDTSVSECEFAIFS